MARGNVVEDVQAETVRCGPLSRCRVGFVLRCRRLGTASKKTVARQRTPSHPRWPDVEKFVLDVGRLKPVLAYPSFRQF